MTRFFFSFCFKGERPKNKTKLKLPPIDLSTESFIPIGSNALPPIYKALRGDFHYVEASNDSQLIETLHNETIKFAVQRNLYVFVRILKCKWRQLCLRRLYTHFYWVFINEFLRFLFCAHSNLLHEQDGNQFHHERNASRQSGRNCHFTGNGRFELPSQGYFPASKRNLSRSEKR